MSTWLYLLISSTKTCLLFLDFVSIRCWRWRRRQSSRTSVRLLRPSSWHRSIRFRTRRPARRNSRTATTAVRSPSTRRGPGLHRPPGFPFSPVSVHPFLRAPKFFLWFTRLGSVRFSLTRFSLTFFGFLVFVPYCRSCLVFLTFHSMAFLFHSIFSGQSLFMLFLRIPFTSCTRFTLLFSFCLFFLVVHDWWSTDRILCHLPLSFLSVFFVYTYWEWELLLSILVGSWNAD